MVGVAGGYVFNVVLQDGTPGAYLASFTRPGPAPRPVASGMLKALIFGMIAADRRRLQGHERRRRARRASATRSTRPWSITFMLLFVVNFVISAIYLQVVPPKTMA